MVCAGCGAESPDSARFCVGCGTSLPRCAACGVSTTPSYRFCPGCGRALSPGAAGTASPPRLASPGAPGVPGGTPLSAVQPSPVLATPRATDGHPLASRAPETIGAEQ